ncbi:hypothetical protein Lalb_Chr17g0347781 [Lupinus albus]|uniref:Uncharacterized protein n=1 Tax=Lupinus albus TaxID=3870 RepID=A0A6A4P741_LUPAL|nr:hypothetical protein Lalb_Chr17g0347781 [Lupinus albus]
MLVYFITCISFFLFIKPLLFLKPLPSWASEVRWISLSLKSISEVFRNHFWLGFLCQIRARMSIGKKNLLTSKVVNVEDTQDMSVLDLPGLALKCILERLLLDQLHRKEERRRRRREKGEEKCKMELMIIEIRPKGQYV